MQKTKFIMYKMVPVKLIILTILSLQIILVTGCENSTDESAKHDNKKNYHVIEKKPSGVFDVEGVYLGQTSIDFINTLRLEDNNYSLRTSYVPNTKIVSGQFLKLYIKVNKSTISGIWFDHEKRLIRLSKLRNYASTPDWAKIKASLISKYGKPKIDRYGQFAHSTEMGTRYGLCWGECKNSDFAYGFVQCMEDKMCMTVVYHTDLNGTDGPAINQELIDGVREKRDSAFYWKQKELHAESDF